MVRPLVTLLIATFIAPALHADHAESGDRKLGHSGLGEVFDEGPRQKAYLMEGMPQVHLEITVKSPEGQKFFDQGLGQLHGFWYYEAERSFRQVAALDSDCAMAYWGMAMANLENQKRARGFADEAKKRREKAGKREQLYIDAIDSFIRTIEKKEEKKDDKKPAPPADPKAEAEKKKQRAEAFAKSYEKLLYEFPDEIEAKALMVGQIWRNDAEGVKIDSYLAIDALLDQIFAKAPMHPAHHYRIHLWDRERPLKALGSAALCGQTAPGIAHMWHMPGHTFSGLKRYADAAWQQEASARVDHAHMMRDRVLPDQIHNFAHNNEWCIRNYIHVGRVREAVALARNMCELPRHPKFNTVEKRGSAQLGRERLMQTLRDFEMWPELIVACESKLIEPTSIAADQQKRLRALGQAYYRSGDIAAGDRLLAHVSCNLAAIQARALLAGSEAAEKLRQEKKPENEITKARDAAEKSLDSEKQSWQSTHDELSGHAAFVRGDYAAAYTLLKKANYDAGALAWVQVLSGKKEEAVKEIEKHAASNENEVLPLARKVEVLHRAEKFEEAKQAFEKLREISVDIDLEAPIFRRLSVIANELDLPGDWRMERAAKNDVGIRPALDSLGPAHWQPPVAPSFVLPSAQGPDVPSSEFAGRGTVLIFFLGHGCLHCAEQLHAFAPMYDRFRAAGFEIVAISSDDSAGLQKSLAAYKGGPLPMRLLSDERLGVFQAYRCYDDFEKTAIHGTFIIDPQGRIRWQDLGAEPFMDPKFVLEEAIRLGAGQTPKGT